MQPLDRKEGSISRSARIVCGLAGTVVVVALVAWYVVGYVISLPPTVPQASAAGVTNVTVQTVASYGHPPHPDWVSYLVKNEQGQWVHSTIWKVPAQLHRARDGAPVRRRQRPAQPVPRPAARGRRRHDDGRTASRSRCSTRTSRRTRSRSPTWASACRSRASPTTPRTSAPWRRARWPGAQHDHVRVPHRASRACTAGSASCPCAAGWLYGFGGPMQTVGWMDGFIKVV